MKQHVTNSSRQLAVIEQHEGQDSARRVFALMDYSEYVRVRVAASRDSWSETNMPPDIALLAYQWLGNWLRAQGVDLPEDARAEAAEAEVARLRMLNERIAHDETLALMARDDLAARVAALEAKPARYTRRG